MTVDGSASAVAVPAALILAFALNFSFAIFSYHQSRASWGASNQGSAMFLFLSSCQMSTPACNNKLIQAFFPAYP